MKTPPEDPRVTAVLATVASRGFVGDDAYTTAAVMSFTVALAGVPEEEIQHLYAAIHGCIVAILPPVK